MNVTHHMNVIHCYTEVTYESRLGSHTFENYTLFNITLRILAREEGCYFL